ncbi:MAG: hypothetical protein K0S74_774 [Chlamydiales bacterium]|jgi:hypothetical protein|nr:hypothetical protein [Chlamydiales bacterium]
MRSGRFEGLTDQKWEKIRALLPAKNSKRGKGMPHVPFRNA